MQKSAHTEQSCHEGSREEKHGQCSDGFHAGCIGLGRQSGCLGGCSVLLGDEVEDEVHGDVFAGFVGEEPAALGGGGVGEVGDCVAGLEGGFGG